MTDQSDSVGIGLWADGQVIVRAWEFATAGDGAVTAPISPACSPSPRAGDEED